MTVYNIAGYIPIETSYHCRYQSDYSMAEPNRNRAIKAIEDTHGVKVVVAIPTHMSRTEEQDFQYISVYYVPKTV